MRLSWHEHRVFKLGGGCVAVSVERVASIFEQPSINGEIAPMPAMPMPAVPAMPAGFKAPEWDPRSASVGDAASGADAAAGR
jgi:hypothetical protein